MAGELPSEGDVIDALKVYLAQRTRPATPSDAYRALADKFNLTQEQRTRLMKDGEEMHWENRVRQAMRKLRIASLIDESLGRGKWALKKRP